jgi:outer membrane protein assembly factor BamB
MKLKHYMFALLGLFFLGACSHFEKLAVANLVAKDDSGLAVELKKVWVKQTTATPDVGYRKSVRMTPLVLKDRIIQGNAFDGITAINRESGYPIWRIPVRGGVEGGISIIKDRLFFGGNDGVFYSASAETGEIFWKVGVRSESLAAPLLEDGVVYFLTGNNVLHALDASDGRELWIYSRVDSQNFSVRGASSPIIKNDSLLLGFSDGYLVALNAKTGTLKWETPLNKNKRFRDIDSTPVVDGEFIYVTGYDSHLYCVRLDTGDLVWKAEPGGFGSVLVGGDRLFYSSSKGEVLAIDKKNGNPLWKFKLSEGIATTPVAYNDYIVVGESQGALRILKKENGLDVGHLSPGHGIFSPIAVDVEKNEFYFISNSALLYKIKAEWRNARDKDGWLL